MSYSKDLARNIAVVISIALVTIAWASTTKATIYLFDIFRLILIGTLVLLLFFLLPKQRSALREVFLGSLVISALGIYSLLLLVFFTSQAETAIYSHVLWIFVVVAIFSTFCLSSINGLIISNAATWIYIYFCFFVFSLTVFYGGLQFTDALHFVYEYTGSGEEQVTYSQGISKFYGLAAIFSAVIVSNSNESRFNRYFAAGWFVVFLILSLIGGGRGDFLFLLLILFFLFIRRLYVLIPCFLYLLFVLLNFESLGFHDDYMILYDRYAALLYSYGMRDELLADSFNLLINEPVCTVVGCGMGFFQSYYGYTLGLYPHNVPVEIVISFGGLFFLLIFSMVALGFLRVYKREGKRSSFLIMFSYFLFVSLKSGSLLTSYILVGSIAFLTLEGTKFFFQRVGEKIN